MQRRRRVELTIADEPTITVRPLGLVLKAGSWHLVVASNDTIEVICIDELRATRLTNQVFTPPVGFDLTEFWQHHTSVQA